MIKFMGAVFALLFFAFWLFSGGSDFTPQSRPITAIIAPQDPASTSHLGQNTAYDIQDSNASTSPDSMTEISPNSLHFPATDQATIPHSDDIRSARFHTPIIEDARAEAKQTSQPSDQPLVELPEPEIRKVIAQRVNMRSGPSMVYNVLDTLVRDTQVVIINIDHSGNEPWAELRVLDTGMIGFMATRFLGPK